MSSLKPEDAKKKGLIERILNKFKTHYSPEDQPSKLEVILDLVIE